MTSGRRRFRNRARWVPAGTFSWAWTELLVSEMERAVTDAARRVVEHAVTVVDPVLAGWAARQGLLAVPFDHELWALVLAVATRQGPAAMARAVRDCRAVLGDDASEVVDRMGGDLPSRRRDLSAEVATENTSWEGATL